MTHPLRLARRVGAALVVLGLVACSRDYPCRGDHDVTVEVLDGPGTVRVTCNGAEHVLGIDRADWQPAFEGSESDRRVTASFYFNTPGAVADAPGPLRFYLSVPRDLPDGEHAPDAPGLDLSVGSSAGVHRGALVVSRSRDVVFSDVPEPKTGRHESTFDLGIELSGRAWVPDCGEEAPYAIPRTRLRLRARTTIRTCRSGLSHH